jgi:hypothetical protein
MRTILNKIVLTCCFSAIFLMSCEKYADNYKDYLGNKEVVYPGVIKNPGYRAGNLQTQLYWNPSPDPSITKYIVSWNNGSSTLEVPATSHNPSDEVRVVIPNLNEYVYTFTIVSYNEEGNSSVKKDVNNVRVYGATYIATLLNRSYNAANPYEFLTNGSLQLNFNKRDTMNVSTTINYTNTSGVAATKELGPEVNAVVISDYKVGTTIRYRSSYQPESNSYDVFNVSQFTDFPTIIKVTQLDKSLFREFRLPTDSPDEYGWVLSRTWDNITGKDQGYHTGGTGMPQSFTINLGQSAQLDNFRIWQRESALYDVGNLKVFEIWGSNSPNPNGSFDSSWTKLGTFTSVKPSGQPRGQNSDADYAFARAGEKFSFPAGTPAVRYVRIKVLETWGAAAYMHFSELSLFKRD